MPDKDSTLAVVETVTKRVLNQRTAAVLDRVTAVGEVVVTEHGKPRWRIGTFDELATPLVTFEREGRYTPLASAPWPAHPGGPASRWKRCSPRCVASAERGSRLPGFLGGAANDPRCFRAHPAASLDAGPGRCARVVSPVAHRGRPRAVSRRQTALRREAAARSRRPARHHARPMLSPSRSSGMWRSSMRSTW